MSWFTIKIDVSPLVPELKLIRQALERIAPEPDADVPLLKPEDAVAYVDEDRMQRAEEIEEMGAEAARLLEYAKEHPDEFPDVSA